MSRRQLWSKWIAWASLAGVGLGVGEAVLGGLLGWATAGALDRANGVAGMG